MNHGNGPGAWDESPSSSSSSSSAAHLVVDPSLGARRVHYAMTGLYVAAAILLQFLLFLRTFHLVFILLASTGFTYVLVGLYIGIMISNVDHLAVFSVGYGQARVIIWTSVVALLFILLNLLQTFFLMTLEPLTAGQTELLQGVNISSAAVDTVELALAHHIHESDQFALVLVLIIFIVVALLHIVSVFVYVRVILSHTQTQLAYAGGRRGYAHVPESPVADTEAPEMPPKQQQQQQQQQQQLQQQSSPPLMHSTILRGGYQDVQPPVLGNNVNYGQDKRAGGNGMNAGTGRSYQKQEPARSTKALYGSRQ